MNKVVVITGASTGLGLSLAKRFLQNKDIVFGISKTEKHWKTAYSQVGKNTQFTLTQADTTDEPAVKRFLNSVLKKAGKIDIVINNAGFGGTLGNVDEVDATEVIKHFKQNLLSAFNVSKNVLPILKKQKKGFIINISSMAGKRAVPGLFAYSASKFGVLALSQCIAKENLKTGVECVTICPGGMNTEMRANIFGESDAKKQQSPVFVADVIFQVANHEIEVESGGDIVIRHGQITAINPAPAA